MKSKLEMIKLNEKGISNAKIDLKLGLFCQIVNQPMNANKKFLKEIKNVMPVNSIMINQNRLIVDMEKILVVG